MRKLITWYAIILIAGHVLTEAHSILFAIWPEVANVELDLFWSPSFKFKLNILWYLKMLGDDLLLCITYFVLAVIAYRYSVALWLVACIFFGYHVADTLMFCWNYKRSPWAYWTLLVAATLSITVLFKVRKTYLYKSLN